MVRVLGIETSCDETAIGIVEDGRIVRANAVASSLELHRPYGGVIPEIACRAHVETIWGVCSEALNEAQLRLRDIDAIAVTQGPGLPGALLIGMAFAKGLALSLERPLVPVDHLAAHLYAGQMVDAPVTPPYVGLVVSGGHTLLCVGHEDARYEVLGETRDDAVGEAFDKVAKLLNLGYPGGPVIDRLSDEGQHKRAVFPRAASKQPFDFSFSGLKTAVYNHVRKLVSQAEKAEKEGSGSAHETNGFLTRQMTADIAAGFQEAAVDILVSRTLRACSRTGIGRVIVGGGVAANRRLRSRMAEEAASKKLKVVFPPPKLCVDNGAMIAGQAFGLLKRGRTAALTLTSDPNLCLV